MITMNEERNYMELLRINNGNAEFLKDDDSYCEIKEIDRNGLLSMLAKIYNDDNIAIISPDIDISTIKDPASKIMFENISAKLKDFFENRDNLRQEISSLFSGTEQQYKDDLS